MSRVASNPIPIPAGVQINLAGDNISIKGAKGQMEMTIHPYVAVHHENNELKVSVKKAEDNGDAHAGTVRALLNNMVTGVSSEFVKELELRGVGYRAQMQGNSLKMTLGFSHDVIFPVPEGISIETPTQTEVVVRGVSKHLVGQVAANIRSYRPPEPYKGKGIRYKGEVVVKKEGKKQ